MTIEGMAQDVWYSCDICFGHCAQIIMCRRDGDKLDRVDSDFPFGPYEGEKDKSLLKELNCYIPNTFVYDLKDIAQVAPVSMQLAEHCESLRDNPNCNW